MQLTYNTPAANWNEALPVGNGHLGAMIFGGAERELLQLNEATLWSGGDREWNNPDGQVYLPQIREAVEKEDYSTATKLARNILGQETAAYMPLGDLTIDFNHGGQISEYKRVLDLEKSAVYVSYRVDGILYKREYFCSHPHRVLAMKFTPAPFFDVSLSSQLRHTVFVDGSVVTLEGKTPEPGGMGFGARAVTIKNAEEAVIFLEAYTDYAPRKRLEKALQAGYDTIKKRHEEDYCNLFNRVSLSIKGENFSNLTTARRIESYTEKDTGLAVLLFQYGRYLMISSSREGGRPANLQGIWNKELEPPWRSNYTLNINLPMNYWSAEVCNLSECHKPLLNFIKELEENGAETAKINYGARGWCAHHNSDFWAFTAPAGNDPVWALWPMGGVWLCSHLFEHYAFNQNKTYLQDFAYPTMKGAALFCLDRLIPHGGHLITNPSTSPEHKFWHKGELVSVSASSTCDTMLIWDLFTNCIEAADILGIDSAFRATLEEAREKLYPIKISVDGRIQEWYKDFADEDRKHRHLSHLYGFFPGRQFKPGINGAMLQAAKTTLETRGTKSTGWGLGWRACLWARLRDGDRALEIYNNFFNLVKDDAPAGGVYPNLLDAHPPFQIDGNFAATAAVAEMLLYSDTEHMYLLPALPKAWAGGKVTGLVARGGFIIDIQWENNKLYEAKITPTISRTCVVKTADDSIEFEAVKGEAYYIY